MKTFARSTFIFLSSIGVAVITSALHADPATQPASTQPTTAPLTINWDEAAKHVGETATVTGPVKGTHVTTNHKSLILNIGKDYPAADRFSVMIAVDDKHPADESAYKDKAVTVTGKIELYRRVPEIKVTGDQVTIAPAQ
jgi:ATP sulfurylase